MIAVSLLLGAVVASACARTPVTVDDASGVPPEERAVHIETTGCRYASGRTGSGVMMGEDVAITVAHLVVGARRLDVTANGTPMGEATVTAVDLERDLAVLRVEGVEVPGVETSQAKKGDQGLIVAGATSGTVPFVVKGVVDLTIEEVRGTDRHSRMGYELDAVTDNGDSGAGVYDEEERLIGVVFATSDEGQTTWATATSEITAFLSGVGPGDTYVACS